jgi:MFS family permease
MNPEEISSYDPRRWIALAAVLCATFLGVLDFLIVNIAIPSIQADLGTTDAEIQLTVAGYGLAYAVCLITGGRLGDIYGRKKMFLLGMAGFIFASVLCGLSQSPQQLVAARVLQGLLASLMSPQVLQGLLASLMSPQVLSIIQVSFPPAERRVAFAVMGAVVGSGSFIGNVFGGWLVGANVAGQGWRPIFFVNVPIGLAALAAAALLVRESKSPSARRLDIPGVILVSLALFALIFPLAEGREQGWPLWAWASLTFSALLMIVFISFERGVSLRGGSPLVELHLFKDRAFSTGLLGIMSIFSGMGVFALALTIFLQDGLKLSPGRAGWTFAPLAVAFFISSIMAVRLQRRIGIRIMQVGLVFMMLSQVAMLYFLATYGTSVNSLLLLPIIFLYGSGQGLTVPTLTSTILSNVPHNDAGSASGVLTTTQQISFSIGIAIIGGAFFTALGTQPQAADFVHAFNIAISCYLALLGITLALVSRLPHAPKVAHAIPVPVEA